MTESRALLTERILLAIHDAVEVGGLRKDEAATIAATVAADFARVGIGESYLAELADVVRHRGGSPLPGAAREPDLFQEPPTP